MLKLVNHYSEFTLSHPSRAPLSLSTLPEETETIHLGTEGIPMTNIVMRSFATRNSEEVMNMQLGGGRRTMQLGGGRRTMQLGGGRRIMQLGDQPEMFQEEKDLSGAKDTEKSKMM